MRDRTTRSLGAVALVSTLLLATTIGASGSSDTAAPAEDAASPTAAPSSVSAGGLLIIVTSQGGGLLDGSLTVDPAAGHFVWFTDRPARESGALTPEDLVSSWKDFGFTTDPPNAALLRSGDGVTELASVLELSSPTLDPATSRLTFAATPVGTATADFEGPFSLVIDSTGSGNLTGFVRDTSEEALPGAVVSADNQLTGTRAMAVSRANGTYTFSGLAAGTYQVTFDMTGFRTERLFPTVKAGATTTLNVTLQLDSVGG